MQDSFEDWKDIPGTEGRYQASTHGRIRSAKLLNHKPRILKLSINTQTQQRYCVRIFINGLWKNQYVHTLVASTFLGARPNGMQVNHKDGNSLNNPLENLEYLTPTENNRHAWANKLFSRARITHFVCGHPTTVENVNIYKWKQFTYRRCRTCKK